MFTVLLVSAPALADDGVAAAANAVDDGDYCPIDITMPGAYYVGDESSSSSCLPFTAEGNYGLVESLYTADEIGAQDSCIITHIGFFLVSSNEALTTSSLRVYIGVTSDDALGSFVDPTSLTLVYEGEPTLGQSGAIEQLELDTPFNYDGTSNLVVAVTKTSGSSNSSLKYECSSAPGMTMYRQSGSSSRYSGVDIAPAGSSSDLRPNIAFSAHSISPRVIIASIPEAAYSGDAQVPNLTVSYGSQTLVEGVDYEVAYENNLNVGTATVIVRGCGNYCGELRTTFEIVPYDADKVDYDTIPVQFFTGSELRPSVVLRTKTGLQLVEGSDYELFYENNFEVGTGIITAQFQGNFSGTKTINFLIRNTTVSDTGNLAAIIAGKTTYSGYLPYNDSYSTSSSDVFRSVSVYSASEIASGAGCSGLIASVAYDVVSTGLCSGCTLEIYMGQTGRSWFAPGANYGKMPLSGLTMVYSGTPTLGLSTGWEQLVLDTPFAFDESQPLIIAVCVKGKSRASYAQTSVGTYYDNYYSMYSADGYNWKGSGVRPNIQLEILPVFSRATIDEIPQQFYTGDDVCPKPLIRFGSKILTEGVDYELSYSNNLEPGTGVLVATGKGDYSGELSAEFDIVRDLAEAQAVTAEGNVYTGQEVCPKVIVSLDGNTLSEGVDYTVSYENNVNVGTATAIISGMGNRFAGEKRVEFTIEPSDISGATITVAATSVYDGRAKEPDVIVAYGDIVLKLGTDYELSYSNNVDVGTALANVKGIGNYTGTLSGAFEIFPVTMPTNTTMLPLNTKDGLELVLYEGGVKHLSFKYSDSGLFYLSSLHSCSSSGYALKLTLRDANGRIVEQWQEKAEIVTHNRYGMALNAGTWYLDVELLKSNTSSSPVYVTLWVIGGSGLTGMDLEYEENDSMAAATELALGKYVYGILYDPAQDVVGAKAEDDYYKFEIDGESLVDVGVSGTSSSKISYALMNESGEVVSSWVTGSSDATERVLKPGTYYVRVNPYDSTAWNSMYTVKVTADALKDIDDCKIEVGPAVYRGDAAAEPSVTVRSADGGLLVEGEHYEVSFENNDRPGIGVAVVKGIGSVEGEARVEFPISVWLGLADASAIADQVYTGSGVEPEIALRYNGELLVQGVDYSLAYSNDDEVGTAKVVATGMGAYAGEVELSFTIAPKAVEVPGAASGLIYTGSEQAGVAAGEGYELSGDVAATNAGEYVATAKLANSNYAWADGTTEPKEVAWSIAPADISAAEIAAIPNQVHTGSAIAPELDVALNGAGLVEGVDYEASYANNVEVGTATATVTGMGNYVGEKSATFQIVEEPHEHNYGAWLSDASGHWKECTCGQKSEQGSHAWGSWTVTKAATAAESGSRERACSVCGYKGVETIPATGSSDSPAPSVTVKMHRLYNPNSGEHFYTASDSEKENLVSVGWSYEGIGWNAPKGSKTPVYRLYNEYGGEHHYTTSEAEKDSLAKAGWKYEGIGWYSDDAKTVPLYRQYNPNAFANNHNYTTSKDENDWLVSLGWKAEGIGWYGV